MANEFWNYVNLVTRSASQLDRTHWVVISILVLVIGLICMRGFGSRNYY
ncbi:MAG TPA: hypothetical protein VFV87_01635 [Pirellulaceae bacterium]|nr:hypothetical protein [Pirellulaceae bacterium]